MSDGKWMLKADAHSIARAVKDYGMIAFIGNGLTDMQNAEVAAKCILVLNQENTSLLTTLSSDKRVDDSYESIVFEPEETAMPTVSCIVRVINYKQIPGLHERRSTRERGPLVPAAKAQSLCDILSAG